MDYLSSPLSGQGDLGRGCSICSTLLLCNTNVLIPNTPATNDEERKIASGGRSEERYIGWLAGVFCREQKGKELAVAGKEERSKHLE
uniref:Uncharacterized protein n=1 Tax=Oryza punctata TaxID=4537 RepID=A0A0E0MCQ4_ORYPU